MLRLPGGQELKAHVDLKPCVQASFIYECDKLKESRLFISNYPECLMTVFFIERKYLIS